LETDESRKLSQISYIPLREDPSPKLERAENSALKSPPPIHYGRVILVSSTVSDEDPVDDLMAGIDLVVNHSSRK
jgi:hypothetical protein